MSWLTVNRWCCPVWLGVVVFSLGSALTGCSGGDAGSDRVSASHRVSAEKQFPLQGGVDLQLRIRPEAPRLDVRALVMDAISLPGVAAAEADYEAATLKVGVNSAQLEAVRARLVSSSLVLAVELAGN